METKSFQIAAALLMATTTLGMTLTFPANAMQVAEAPQEQSAVVHQLRIYEIFENNKAAFHQRFIDHAARIMQRYDFKIVAMWESSLEGRTEFVYFLEWRDEPTMKRQWERFMADREWSDIKARTAAEHGRLVGKIESRVLHLADHSPAQRGLLGAQVRQGMSIDK